MCVNKVQNQCAIQYSIERHRKYFSGILMCIKWHTIVMKTLSIHVELGILIRDPGTEYENFVQFPVMGGKCNPSN